MKIFIQSLFATTIILSATAPETSEELNNITSYIEKHSINFLLFEKKPVPSERIPEMISFLKILMPQFNAVSPFSGQYILIEAFEKFTLGYKNIKHRFVQNDLQKWKDQNKYLFENVIKNLLTTQNILTKIFRESKINSIPQQSQLCAFLTNALLITIALTTEQPDDFSDMATEVNHLIEEIYEEQKKIEAKKISDARENFVNLSKEISTSIEKLIQFINENQDEENQSVISKQIFQLIHLSENVLNTWLEQFGDSRQNHFEKLATINLSTSLYRLINIVKIKHQTELIEQEDLQKIAQLLNAIA